MSPIAIVVAIFTVFAVLLILRALLVPAQTESEMLEARLARFADSEAPATLSDVELSMPFFDRAVRPTLDRLGRWVSERMPAQAQQRLQEQLDLAGRPWGLSVGGFQVLSVAAFLVGLVIGYLLAVGLGLQGTYFIAMIIFGAVIGLLPPRISLQRAAANRQKEILLGLPSALDLITISVEAGLSFDAALARVTEKYKNALSREFNQYLNEIRLGVARADALDAMGKRSHVEEFNNFIQAIIQSDQLGVGVANVLRIQSEELRRRRRQRAEEAGQKAPLKMLFPMVGCIFPTLFVVLLGPAALLVASEFGGH